MARLEVSSTVHVCCACGEGYGRKKGNFYVSYGALYKGSGHMPYCMRCVDAMFDEYLRESKDRQMAVRQMCRKLDLYWNQSLFESAEKISAARSTMTNYLSKIGGPKHAGKSYDDTLREDGVMWFNEPGFAEVAEGTMSQDSTLDEEEIDIPDGVMLFWGPGYTPKMYHELEERRRYWMTKYPEGTVLDIGTEAIIRQICNLEIDINHARAADKQIDKYVNTLNTLLGSANLKPTQKKNDDSDAELDNMPFGVGIRRWENTRPVPDIDPEFEDVDGIKKLITVWFYGHTAKAAGLKTATSKLYENEISRLRVERPEFDDEDEDDLLNVVFRESDGDTD